MPRLPEPKSGAADSSANGFAIAARARKVKALADTARRIGIGPDDLTDPDVREGLAMQAHVRTPSDVTWKLLEDYMRRGQS